MMIDVLKQYNSVYRIMKIMGRFYLIYNQVIQKLGFFRLIFVGIVGMYFHFNIIIGKLPMPFAYQLIIAGDFIANVKHFFTPWL